MPAVSASSPDAMAWFGSARGLPLLAAERDLVASLLEARSPQPWLWLAPGAGPGPDAAATDLPPRGLRLHRERAQLAGAFRCRLPLPLPNETFGSIVVQHVLDDGGLPGLLEEAERVLQPGGRLWLFALNPYSPYRLRWRNRGFAVRAPIDWRLRLRAAGLHVYDGIEAAWLGPVWRGRSAPSALAGLRACCVLGAEKRVAPLTPVKAAAAWRADAAPAGL
jgi:SAM-dependent methyltransferase